MKIKAFIDANIIIDFLIQREPFNISAALLFEYIKRNEITAYTSANNIANIHYILSNASKQSNVRQKISENRKLMNLVSTDEKIIDNSLTSNLSDFEDAIQYYSAIACDADYIITRDPDGYKKSVIRIVNAEEMNKIIEDRRENKRVERT